MNDAYAYLVFSALLMLLQWTPYIVNRLFVWGPVAFLNNYPEGFPATEPEPPLWAQRAKRAHLNMVETFPAFAVAVLIAGQTANVDPATVIYAAVFFYSRLVYTLVYSLGIPFLRTPSYLVSWGATLMILFGLVSA